MIDAPVFIRQLSQRHMTACAVLLDIIMWRLMAARQTQLSLVGGMSLGGAVLRLVSETRSSKKGQKRERGLKKHVESYIVKSDGLLSMHWLSFVPPPVQLCSHCTSLTRVNQLSSRDINTRLNSHSNTWTKMGFENWDQINKDHFCPLLTLQLANESRKKLPEVGELFDQLVVKCNTLGGTVKLFKAKAEMKPKWIQRVW